MQVFFSTVEGLKFFGVFKLTSSTEISEFVNDIIVRFHVSEDVAGFDVTVDDSIFAEESHSMGYVQNASS